MYFGVSTSENPTAHTVGCVTTSAVAVTTLASVLKAAVDGGVSVPVYVDEEDLSFGALIKQATALGMGGWWLGGGHMKPNPQFLNQVQQQVPKQEAKVIVACQKGLR